MKFFICSNCNNFKLWFQTKKQLG